MKKITLAVQVQTEEGISETDLVQILTSLIQIGITDAKSTIEKGDGDIDTATKAAAIDITSVNTIKVPRVLVRIQDGIGEIESDQEIDSYLCYVDTDNANPEFDHAPAKFADLAAKFGLPVLGADHE